MNDWREEDGMLTQTFECENYRAAIDLVNRIAVAADDADHHPDILIFDNKFVSVMLRTHSADAITEKDHGLSQRIDDLIEGS